MSWIRDKLLGLRSVFSDGEQLPERGALEFAGDGVEVEDDPTNKRTLVTIAGGGSGVVDPDPDTLAQRGPEGELKAARFELSGARIISGAPTQVGDLSFRTNGRPRVYSQALGAAEDVLLRSDVFREYRDVWPEESDPLWQGTEILSMPANVPLVLRRCMIFPTADVTQDLGDDFAVIALEASGGVGSPVTLASASTADNGWPQLAFFSLTATGATVAAGQRVQWTIYKEGAGKLLPKITMIAEFLVDPSYSG